ncbi:MAG: GyrI-like domain-containing protein [Magnetococcales bacterium]|nr:GyrI-like domain-containing protein [Magnetococcales bacterium]
MSYTPVKIVDFQETHVAVLEHRGDPALIDHSVRTFITWRRSVGLSPGISATFNIFYGHPTTTAPENFRLDLCAATEHTIAPNDAGIVARLIPGGRCAVLRHTGSDEGLAAAASYLCRDWLPQSGEERRDFPLYCQRVHFFPEVPATAAITDIFLPLQ